MNNDPVLKMIAHLQAAKILYLVQPWHTYRFLKYVQLKSKLLVGVYFLKNSYE
jgi:hypothetical protein